MRSVRERPWVFVDLETTGTAAARERITEVAVVRVGPEGDTEEWSTLVHPEQHIAPMITAITGIDDAMVRDAPRFADIAEALQQRLAGALFVAHNVSFDYGFVKAEFARLGQVFEAPTLCTVRLSRQLYPERSPHTLDAIVSRHRLGAAMGDAARHRALGDARLIHAFLAHLERDLEPEVLDAAVRRLVVDPSAPRAGARPARRAAPRIRWQ